MSDYQNGKIYIISCSLGPEVYYGSTIQTLKKRMYFHKKMRYCSRLIFEKYGFENCKIDLVEDYPCNSRKELEAREGWYIRNNVCVNIVVPGRTPAEWCIDNKEKVKGYKAQYYKNNKGNFTCECGAVINKCGKTRHEKTKKHMDYIKEIIVEKII